MESDTQKQGRGNHQLSKVNTTLLALANERPVEKITLEQNGKQYDFNLSRLTSLADYNRLVSNIRKRYRALESCGGKLPVTIDRKTAEDFGDYLFDIEPNENGAEIYVEDEKEIDYATVIECATLEPSFTWPEAVVFTRVNGTLAIKLVREFYNLNIEKMRENTKKG